MLLPGTYIRYRILYTTNYKFAGHWPEAHTKSQATQNVCLPSLLGDGNREIEIVYSEEKNILYWALEQPRLNKISITGTTSKLTNPGRTPFICTLLVPIHLSFNSQQGPPLFSLSGIDIPASMFWLSCIRTIMPQDRWQHVNISHGLS